MSGPADPTGRAGAPVRVRSVRHEDAEDLARLHNACWRQTYRHLLSPGFLAGLDDGVRARTWRRIAAERDSPAWVATRGDRLVGFAGTRPGVDGPRRTELWGLYVLAELHGTGLGQRLLDTALGERSAFLWCALDNPRAHAFYARNGFGLDGGRTVVPEWEDMVEVRLTR